MVLEQSPAGGAHARKGTTVTIVVGALAPQTTTTPTTTTTTTTTTPRRHAAGGGMTPRRHRRASDRPGAHGRRPRRRALLRARRLAVLRRRGPRRVCARPGTRSSGSRSGATALGTRREAAERAPGRLACSGSMSCSQCSTARLGRTGPCRGCWRRSMSHTWERAWQPRRCAWTRCCSRPAVGAPACPRSTTWGWRAALRTAPEQVLGEIAALGLPVFVKPRTWARRWESSKLPAGELAAALEQAFAHDELAIVEAMAPGIEVECGVLGLLLDGERRAGGDGRARQPGRAPTYPGRSCSPGEWYDYAAKYTHGGMALMIPARISDTARAAGPATRRRDIRAGRL